jgi:hypothetical protein
VAKHLPQIVKAHSNWVSEKGKFVAVGAAQIALLGNLHYPFNVADVQEKLAFREPVAS